MSLISPVAVFGVKSDIHQNIAFFEERQFVYVAGQYLVIGRCAHRHRIHTLAESH